MQLAKYTIGAKIFGAFTAMGVIIGVMGLAGYGVLSAAGGIAVTTFDGPLMAINYARAAQTDFTEMQIAELRYEHARPAEREKIAGEISGIFDNFTADLEVAKQRSLAADEQKVIAQIEPLVRQWRDARARGDVAELTSLDQRIDDKFDLLIEFNTDHSFIGRRQTVTNIGHYK